MTLSTTSASHAHATACQDTRRTVALPAVPPTTSRTMSALAECLATWGAELHESDRRLRHTWSTVAELHRRIASCDELTAGALRGPR